MSRAATGLIGLALTLLFLGIAFVGTAHGATFAFHPEVPGITTVSPASAGTFAGMTVRDPDGPPVTP